MIHFILITICVFILVKIVLKTINHYVDKDLRRMREENEFYMMRPIIKERILKACEEDNIRDEQ